MKNLTDFRKTVETGMDPPLRYQRTLTLRFTNITFRGSLRHIPFFLFFRYLVCFNRSLLVHSILRDRLHLAFLLLQSRGHWNTIQFGKYL